MTDKIFQSTKTYDHNVGLSACFRQWRSTHSHCQYLHGYALKVKMTFESNDLDERNWIVDFGGLKEIKQWLENTFDHKTVVAEDDPHMKLFEEMARQKLIDLVVVKNVGCERFAEMIFDRIETWLAQYNEDTGRVGLLGSPTPVKLRAVEVSEHSGNSAICLRKKHNV